MRPILVIDGGNQTNFMPVPDRSGARYDAVIADACMLDTTPRIRKVMADGPGTQLIAISNDGAATAICDAPDFQAMAVRLRAQCRNREGG
jgi:hypothetical protein